MDTSRHCVSQDRIAIDIGEATRLEASHEKGHCFVMLAYHRMNELNLKKEASWTARARISYRPSLFGVQMCPW